MSFCRVVHHRRKFYGAWLTEAARRRCMHSLIRFIIFSLDPRDAFNNDLYWSDWQKMYLCLEVLGETLVREIQSDCDNIYVLRAAQW